MQLEATACLLCGSAATLKPMDTRDRLCGLPGAFALVRCRNCGLTYLNPRPDAASIGEYYPAAYDPHQIDRIDDLPALKRLTVRYGLLKRCKAVLAYKRGGTILDVGCATGLFLAEMLKTGGWQAFGVEPGAQAAAAAYLAHGLEVHVGDLASARYPDRMFDAVTLWDVLEHLHDPLAVMCEVRRILKADGILVMRTPSLRSWDSRVFGRYWAGLDSPRHLAIFTPGTLAALLEKAGFRVVTSSTGTGSYIIFLLSLRFWFADRIQSPSRRAAVLRLFDNPFARALALVPFAVTDRLGYVAALTVTARPALQGSEELVRQHD
jgi:SAM-dependent methyltransferase